MSKIFKTILLIVLMLLPMVLLSSPVYGSNKDGKSIRKITGTPNKTKLNINNISTWIYNNGDSDIDPTANAGFQFPAGSGKTCVFESGFIWGASVNGQVRVGGSTYSSGLQPGKIQADGTPESPDLPKNRIYRVRPDYKTAVLTTAARDEGISEEDIRTQYQTDWNEWPAADGAPFEDVNGDGVYDPNTDIPGVPGASQTIWYVCNDQNPSLTTKLYGSQPMGIEMQVTIWAYNQAGPLSNMYFRRYLIINKSKTPFTNMYVSMWSDVDDGDATDDYSGCDTTLSLGYTYNSSNNDGVYAKAPPPITPPAVGFDFFQGPVVSGKSTDSAIFRGGVLHGKKNLPMTAFYYFARGDLSVTDPTLASYEGTTQFYNFMQGRIGKTGEFFKTPQGVPSTFVLSGDPVTGKGWVDGVQLPAGDRRQGLASGPFTMAAGDTQEVVVAEIAAFGTNNLTAITTLKSYDQKAQDAYNSFFKIPSGAPPPVVNVAELDKKIILSWGDPATANLTESYNSNGFKFQGYNVYQLPSPSATLDQAVLIATYDLPDTIGTIYGYVFNAKSGKPELTPIEFGTNSGISRSITVTRDALNGGLPLNNGSNYYFAVTSYAFNPDPTAVPNVLENPINAIITVPHAPNPGTRYPGASGDTLKTIAHKAGASDAIITPIIIDPTKLTGHTYNITFNVLHIVDTVAGTSKDSTLWTVVDSTTGKTIVNNQGNISGDQNYFIFDGIQLKVQGPPPGMKDYSIPAGKRTWTFSGASGFNLEGFSGAIGNAFNNWFSGSSVPLSQLPNVLIKFATTDTLGNILNPNDPNASFAYRYLRGASADPAKPEFAPFIKNKTAGYAFQDYTKSMPFAAFNNETNPPTRLMVGYLENNVAGGRVDGKYWPPASDQGIDNVASTGPREWFFIFNVPYSETPDPALETDILDNTTPMLWMGTPNRRGANSVVFNDNDQFLILSNKIITNKDVFSFTAPQVTTGNQTYAQSDIQSINVFPNPYYGVNPQEINKYQRFVTFSHLPQNATIRIFNISGQLIKTITRTGAPTQFEQWDLANEAGLPVGSGMYIVHIDMGTLGSKILKVAIIQEQQVLDRF